ncbi:MAG: alkaline phytoceramidase [Gammaproteobacteria bacterium]|nr:alkaline phytoceramidase [Gammaproteobacteria bacterium]
MPSMRTFRPARRTRHLLLVATLAAVIVAALAGPPLGQPQAYHAFADGRAWSGIPNALDVLSSLAFLGVGLLGLRFVARGARSPAFAEPGEALPYAVLFAATALAGLGSAYYHVAPDDARLAWDRLPMAAAFMALLAATLGERIDRRLGRTALLPLTVAGLASVGYWRWGLAAGGGDLAPYVAVQFGGLLLILETALLYPSRYTRGGAVWLAGLLYAVAKLAEAQDRAIFLLTGFVSGHTLKHLLAAAAVYVLLHALARRSPVGA